MPCLFASSTKPIWLGDGEKRGKRLVAEIDDLGDAVVGDQPVEQRHLPVDVADRRRGGVLGQELRQRVLAGVEIEAGDGAALVQMKVDEQPRQQRLADARPRRGDDGHGTAQRHQITGRRRSPA